MNKLIQNAASQQKTPNSPRQNLNTAIDSLLDKEHLRKRFEELLGKRTPQFMSSLVALLNATPALQAAFFQSPMTVIQSALKAAMFDLPIDPNLGFAYIVPFNRKEKRGEEWVKIPEAQFIIGYKGMQQLALRTGAYKTLNVIELREGELKSYNRLTEDIQIEFIEDDTVRENAKITGYVGYFRLINGTEKTVYMSIRQIETHERKHRKGKDRSKGWKDDFEAMCAKTVMRRLIGKWGLMSIDYQQASAQTIATAEAIAAGDFDDEDKMLPIEGEAEILPDNFETGEIIETETTVDEVELPFK